MPLKAQSSKGSTAEPVQYSAFAVFPASLDSLSKAVAEKPSVLAKLCRRNAVEATLNTAMHQYESLMVLNLAQFRELEHKMKDPSEEHHAEREAAADRRLEMMHRADTMFGWHDTPSASCVFTLEDLRLLKDTLTATDAFLAQCESVQPTPSKNFWDKAVKAHGDGRKAEDVRRVASERLRCDARAAVDQLLQWSVELQEADASETTSAKFKNYIQEKQVELDKLSEQISWPGDGSERPSTASLVKLPRTTHLAPTRSRSPGKSIMRSCSSLRLGGNHSKSGPQNGDETICSLTEGRTANRSDIPRITVT